MKLKHSSTFCMHWIKGMKWDVVSRMNGWTMNGTVWTTKGLTSYTLPHPHFDAGVLNVNKI